MLAIILRKSHNKAKKAFKKALFKDEKKAVKKAIINAHKKGETKIFYPCYEDLHAPITAYLTRKGFKVAEEGHTLRIWW